jgi:hypothetical protein
VTARVAYFKSASENRPEGNTGHDAELAFARHGVRETPIGHSCAHTTLDDDGQV